MGINESQLFKKAMKFSSNFNVGNSSQDQQISVWLESRFNLNLIEVWFKSKFNLIEVSDIVTSKWADTSLYFRHQVTFFDGFLSLVGHLSLVLVIDWWFVLLIVFARLVFLDVSLCKTNSFGFSENIQNLESWRNMVVFFDGWIKQTWVPFLCSTALLIIQKVSVTDLKKLAANICSNSAGHGRGPEAWTRVESVHPKVWTGRHTLPDWNITLRCLIWTFENIACLSLGV